MRQGKGRGKGRGKLMKQGEGKPGAVEVQVGLWGGARCLKAWR